VTACPALWRHGGCQQADFGGAGLYKHGGAFPGGAAACAHIVDQHQAQPAHITDNLIGTFDIR
jgi:hypothetical protein